MAEEKQNLSWVKKAVEIGKSLFYTSFSMLGGFIIHPLNLIQQRKKLGIQTSSVEIFTETAKTDIFGLWKGSLMSPVFSGCQTLEISIETYLKKIYNTNDKLYNTTFLLKLYSVVVAKSITSVISYPLRTIETRLCCDQNQQYSGFVDCVTKMWSESQLWTFYQGYFLFGAQTFLCNLFGLTFNEMVEIEFGPLNFNQKVIRNYLKLNLILLLTHPMNVLTTRMRVNGMPIGNGKQADFQTEGLTFKDFTSGLLESFVFNNLGYTASLCFDAIVRRLKKMKKNEKKEKK
jgi:hypothetical protein